MPHRRCLPGNPPISAKTQGFIGAGSAIPPAAKPAVRAAGQAAAQTEAPPQAVVSYADLDLSRATGRAVLQHRIEAAANRVCLGEPSPVDLKATQIFRTCRQAAMSGAQTQLAAIYGGAKLAQAAITVGPGKR
jgi:UrcA family protein